jgi:hypothetical protein
MITQEAAEETLRPWLGGDFLSRNRDAAAQATTILESFRPERGTLPHLAKQLDNLLFMAVREDSGGRMALVMDTGQLIRLRMHDFALMADELLYLLFQSLPRIPFNQATIREYSMRSGSLSALRALFLLYRDLQSPEETETIRRVITSCHEPYRFRHWIDEGT